MCQIQLNTSIILNVPLETFCEPFTFVVNDKEYQTSRLLSDLLSPKISQLHKNDPLIDRYIINTKSKGDFSIILQLLNFEKKTINEEDIEFIIEIIENLCNGSIKIYETTTTTAATEITKENVMNNLLKHQQFPYFYHSSISNEIDFISSHFYELFSKENDQYEQLKHFDLETINQIISNPHLQLNDEDQLIEIINELYSNDHKYFVLYEKVYFENVNQENMKSFIQIFDHNEITNDIWYQLCSRLESEVKIEITNKNENEQNNDKNQCRYRYKRKSGKTFSFNENNNFNGIINYLRNESSGQIENEINITGSSCNGGGYELINAINYDNKKTAGTNNKEESWICFEFKEKKIIPTDYTIRSSNYCGQNWHHPKSWVLEISNDKNRWEIIDTQNECSYLNGQYLTHTFKIQNPPHDGIHFIRIRQTNKNWGNSHHLFIDSFEIFGQLI